MKTQGKVWIIFDVRKNIQSKAMSLAQTQASLLNIPKKDHDKFFLWTPGWSDWISIRAYLKSDQKFFVDLQPPQPTENLLKSLSEKTKPMPSEAETLTASMTQKAAENENLYTQVIFEEISIHPESNNSFYMKDFHAAELDLKKIDQVQKTPSKKSIDSSPLQKIGKNENSEDRRQLQRHGLKIEIVLMSKVRSFRSFSKNISLSGTLLEHDIPFEFRSKPFEIIIVNPFEKDPKKARLLFNAKIVLSPDPRRVMFIDKDPAMSKRLEALLKAYVAYEKQVNKSAG